MSSRARVAASAVLLLAAVTTTLTVVSAAPADAREPSPPTNCRVSSDRGAVARARCESGYGTFRAWALCSHKAGKVYGSWMHPSKFNSSNAWCAPAGAVMAYGIEKREG
ncbi:hypothetical protein GCM10029976_071690 [Kribbella albertanoniae]